MGFFDTYTVEDFGGGLSYVGKAEKEALIDSGESFQVVRVLDTVSKFGPKFVAISVLDGEERALSFSKGSVASRDALFAALKEYLESGEAEDVFVKLQRSGNAILVVQGSE